MELTNEVLRAELENDPLGLGYAELIQTANDAAIAAILNEKEIAGNRFVYNWQVKAQAYKSTNAQGMPVWMALVAAKRQTAEATLGAAAEAVIDYINDRNFQSIDVRDAATVLMFGVLQSYSLMTADNWAAMVALSQSKISRAEQLYYGQGVSVPIEAIAGPVVVSIAQVGECR